jgi:hypothetical protein
MTLHSWPAIGSAAALSFAVASFSWSPALAAEGKDIVEGWKAWGEALKVEGLTFRIADVEEAEGGSVTVMKGLAVSWSGEIEVPPDAEGRPPQSFRFSLSADVPEVRFVDLTRTSEGFAAASFAAPVTTIKASGGVGDETVSFVEVLHQYTSTEPRWPALADIADDPSRPFSRFQPLLQTGLKWSTKLDRVERTDLEFSQPGVEQQMTVGPMEIAGVAAGTVARMTLGAMEGTAVMELPSIQPNADGTTPPPSRQTAKVSQAAQEFLDYSIAPIYAALFESGPGRGRAPETILGSGTAGAISFSAPEFGYTVGAQTIADVRLGVPEVNIANEIDRLILAAQAGSVDPVDIVDLALTFYQGFSIGKLSTDGFSVDTPVFTTKVGEIALDRLSKDGLRLFSIGAIDARGEDGPDSIGSFRLGRFAIRDVVFPAKDAIVALARLESDPLGGGQPIEPSTRQVLDVVPMIGGIDLEGLSVDSPMIGAIALDRFSVALGGFVPPVPTETSIELSGLSFPTALVTDPDAKAFLEQAGIEQVEIDGRYATKWTEGPNTFDLDPFAVSVEGLGAAEVTMALSGVPRTVFEQPDKAQLAMPQVMVEGVTASFANAPKLAGPLADFAKQQSISPETAIGVIGDVVRNELAPMAGDGFADSLDSAVKQFLTGPTGTLQLTARPAQPVPLVQVVGAATMAPGSLVKLLNAVVEYRQ